MFELNGNHFQNLGKKKYSVVLIYPGSVKDDTWVKQISHVSSFVKIVESNNQTWGSYLHVASYHLQKKNKKSMISFNKL